MNKKRVYSQENKSWISIEEAKLKKLSFPKNRESECICRQDLGYGETHPIVLHLLWCPEGYTVKEYDALPWYKKILRIDPRSWRYINRGV